MSQLCAIIVVLNSATKCDANWVFYKWDNWKSEMKTRVLVDVL